MALMNSYTPTGSTIFKLRFLHEYQTKNVKKNLYQVMHQGQDKNIKNFINKFKKK